MRKRDYGKKKLLIVDDNREYLDELNKILTFDYKLINVESINEAQKILKRYSNIKLAIVDINLEDDRDKLGLGLLDNLKNKRIPTIAISAVFDIEAVRNAFVFGGVRYFWFKHLDEKFDLSEAIKRIFNDQKDIVWDKKGIKSALLPIAITLISFTVIIFLLLIAITKLIPESLILVIVVAGIVLICFLIISLLLFINKITGEQFTEIVKDLIKLFWKNKLL